jgi:hypothetical protein
MNYQSQSKDKDEKNIYQSYYPTAFCSGSKQDFISIEDIAETLSRIIARQELLRDFIAITRRHGISDEKSQAELDVLEMLSRKIQLQRELAKLKAREAEEKRW